MKGVKDLAAGERLGRNANARRPDCQLNGLARRDWGESLRFCLLYLMVRGLNDLVTLKPYAKHSLSRLCCYLWIVFCKHILMFVSLIEECF